MMAWMMMAWMKQDHLQLPNLLLRTVWKPDSLPKMDCLPACACPCCAGLTSSMPWAAVRLRELSRPDFFCARCSMALLTLSLVFLMPTRSLPVPCESIPRPTPPSTSSSASSPNFSRFCCFCNYDIACSSLALRQRLPPLRFLGAWSGTGSGRSMRCSPPSSWIFSNRSRTSSRRRLPSPLPDFSTSARTHLAALEASMRTRFMRQSWGASRTMSIWPKRPVWLRSPTLRPTCPARCPPITWMLQAGIPASSLMPPASEISLEATRLPSSWQRLGATACMQDSRYISSRLLSSLSRTTASTCSSTPANSPGANCSCTDDSAICSEIRWWFPRYANPDCPPSISRTALQYSPGCVTIPYSSGKRREQTAFTARKQPATYLAIAEAYSLERWIITSCGTPTSACCWLMRASTRVRTASMCSRKAALPSNSLFRTPTPTPTTAPDDSSSEDSSGMASSSRSLRSLRMSSSSIDYKSQDSELAIILVVRVGDGSSQGARLAYSFCLKISTIRLWDCCEKMLERTARAEEEGARMAWLWLRLRPEDFTELTCTEEAVRSGVAEWSPSCEMVEQDLARATCASALGAGIDDAWGRWLQYCD